MVWCVEALVRRVFVLVTVWRSQVRCEMCDICMMQTAAYMRGVCVSEWR